MRLEEILDGKETLIGKGRTGRIYKIEVNPANFVRKEFSPHSFTRLWTWFFYKSPHPLSTETGYLHAYWKRRLANRMGKYIDGDIHIVDSLKISQNGFVSPFIEGRMPAKEEMQSVYAKTQKLEEVFDDIGMPTQSFRHNYLLSRRKNFIIQNGTVWIVDYEQSVPMPDTRGNMGYDIIYFDEVHRFLNDNKSQILDRLGSEEMRHLEEAFVLAKQYQAQLDIRPRGVTKFGEKFSKSLSRREIDKTVEILYRDGKITEGELEAYRGGETGENIRLAVMNLGVHSAIGLATPPYIATFHSAGARLVWTLANWGYYTAIGDDKRRIHNWRVMVVGALPLPFPLSFLSNGAYLISIMEENPQIGLAIEDNLIREFTDKGLEEMMQLVGSKRIIRHVLKAYETIYHNIPPSIQEKVLGTNTKKAHDILLSYMMEGANKNQNGKTCSCWKQ